MFEFKSESSVQWLLNFLEKGPDDPIPNDYNNLTYLIDQLSRSNVDVRANFAKVASDLLTDVSFKKYTADFLQILAEVGVDNSMAVEIVAPVVTKLLTESSSQREQKESLHLLSRCKLPSCDWLALLVPYLDSPVSAMLAYLAILKQVPDQAPVFLSQVLKTAKEAGIPTDLFLFKLKQIEGEIKI